MDLGVNEESRAIERYMQGCAFGGTAYHYDLLPSTQTEAKRLAGSGAKEGTLVVARRQTAGYGREGNAWHSAAGGLWFSLILRPKFSASYADQLSIRLGFAAAQALNEQVPGVLFEVKPPNDVLAVTGGGARKKVCGFLLEGSTDESEGYDWLILGVGLNVNNELTSELKPHAATLEEITGKPVPRMPMLKSLLCRLAETYSRFSSTV